MNTIGEKLRDLRGEKSIAIVSKDTGISEKSLYSYENDDRIPSDERKYILANYFKTSIDSLFFEHYVDKDK